jgi:hypothetical protein
VATANNTVAVANNTMVPAAGYARAKMTHGCHDRRRIAHRGVIHERHRTRYKLFDRTDKHPKRLSYFSKVFSPAAAAQWKAVLRRQLIAQSTRSYFRCSAHADSYRAAIKYRH